MDGQPSAKSRGGRRSDGTADHQLPSSVGELLEPSGKGTLEAGPRMVLGSERSEERSRMTIDGFGVLPVPLA